MSIDAVELHVEPSDKGDSDNNLTRNHQSYLQDSLFLPEPCRKAQIKKNEWLATGSRLFKGIKNHVGDLHFSDILILNKVIIARNKIDVVAEYTFIETFGSRREPAEGFPAIYVPGECVFAGSRLFS